MRKSAEEFEEKFGKNHKIDNLDLKNKLQSHKSKPDCISKHYLHNKIISTLE